MGATTIAPTPSTARPPACTAELTITPSMREAALRAGHAVAPHAPLTIAALAVCALEDIEGHTHLGVVCDDVPAGQARPRSVWMAWGTTAGDTPIKPSAVALHDCRCGLFDCHPGDHLDRLYDPLREWLEALGGHELLTRLLTVAELDATCTGLGALATWRTRPWPQVVTAAETGFAALLSELRRTGLWSRLSAADQAAVVVLAQRTSILAGQWRPHQHSARIDSLAAEVARETAYFALACESLPDRRWVTVDRRVSAPAATAALTALRALPPAWQAEVFRRSEPGAGGYSSPRCEQLPFSVALVSVGDDHKAGATTTRHRSSPHAVAGDEMVCRLDALPHGFQIEACRRMIAGDAPAAAISTVQASLNYARTVKDLLDA